MKVDATMNNNVTFISELSQFSQIIIYNRIVNYLADEEGMELGEAFEKAEESMNEKISILYGDRTTAETVDFGGVVVEDENGNYVDILNPNNIICEDRARDIAIWWSYERSLYCISYDELFEIGQYFEELADRFPNLREEFEENAIL
jgi:hypothetical protein